jgi:hypothetical protein
LVFGGLTLLYWLTGSILWTVLRSPSGWITAAVGYFVFFITSVHLLAEVSRILVDALRNLIPPGGWLLLSLVLVGLGFLWTVSLRRLTQRREGV